MSIMTPRETVEALDKYIVGQNEAKRAVAIALRNRVRRRLREIYRLNERRFCAGYDIVVVARGRSVSADYRRLEREFLRAAAGLGLLKKEEEA